MNMRIGLVRSVGSAASVVLIYVLLAQAGLGAELSAVKAEGGITVDGDLSDPGWRKAQLAIYNTDIKGQKSESSTEVAVAYDDDNIYVSFVCRHPRGMKVNAKKCERDGGIWSDEIVELFLDPGLSRQKYYQVAVNAEGSFYDSFVPAVGHDDAGRDLGVKTAVRKDDDKWVLEMAIPVSDLNLPSSIGADWGINFCRTYVPQGGDNVLLNWAGYEGGFQQPDKFGVLHGVDFGKRAGASIDFPENEIMYGDGKLPVKISGLSGAVTAVVDVAIMDNAGKEVVKTQTGLEIPAAGGALDVPYNVDLFEGQIIVSVTVKDPVSSKVLATALRKMKFGNLLGLDVKKNILYLGDKPMVIVRAICDEEMLKRMSVNCEVKDEAGKKQALAPLAVGGRKARLQAPISEIGEGQYELNCELRDGEKVLKKVSAPLAVIKGPFDPSSP